MKKVGILGGSFDPVHFGHLMLAEQARNEAGLDKVIFMPAWISPFKLAKKQAGGECRYEMVKRAVASNPFFEVSRLELDREEVSYTIHTMRRLRELLGSGVELFFITGADAFLSIEKWTGAEELLAEFSFLIGRRPGFDPKLLKQQTGRLAKEYGNRFQIMELAEMEISSTDIREKVAAGLSVRYQMPAAALEYIYENEVYASTKDRITAYLERTAKQKRLRHIYGVAETAKTLAERFGCGTEKAELCALFHDACRQVGALEHGEQAAILMAADYGIKDLDMINAVRYHTTGRTGMSTLEKLIYLADAIEPGRSYPGVEALRAAAEKNLNEAVLMAMEHTIEYLQLKNCMIDERTLTARDELKKQRKENV